MTCRLILLIAVFGATLPAEAEMFDREKFKEQLRRDAEDQIVEALSKLQEKADEYQEHLKDKALDGAFQIIKKKIQSNPKLRALLSKEDPRSVYQAAKKTLGAENVKLLESAYSDYREGKSKEILTQLKGKFDQAKSRINNLLGLSQELDECKDKAKIPEILEKYGFKDRNALEKLAKREAGIRKAVSDIKGRYGDTYEIFKTLHEGFTGEEVGSELDALFTIMEGYGGKIPILGDFIEAYGKVGKELLAATRRLKKSFARVDDGCVGVGSYGWLSSKDKRNHSFSQKYPGRTGWPCYQLEGLYEDLKAPNKLYYWDGSAWTDSKRGVGGDAVFRHIAHLLKAQEKRYGKIADPATMKAALAYYDIDYPGGFEALYNKALETLREIRDRAKRMEDAFVYYANGSAEKWAGILQAHCQYDKKALDDLWYTKQSYFAYRFIRGFKNGKGDAYENFTKMREAIFSFDLRIIWGAVEELEGAEATRLVTKKSDSVTVLHESLLEDGTYGYALRVRPGSAFHFLAEVDLRIDAQKITTVESRLARFNGLAAKTWRKYRRHLTFGDGPEITLDDPKAEKNEIVVGATIDGGLPDFDYQWSTTAAKKGEKGTAKKRELKWRFPMPEPGVHVIELKVVDVLGRQALQVIDFSLEDELQLALAASTTTAEPDKPVSVTATFAGLQPPYALVWTTSTGMERKASFKQPGTSTFDVSFGTQGTHTVTAVLKARGADGQEEQAAESVRIMVNEAVETEMYISYYKTNGKKVGVHWKVPVYYTKKYKQRVNHGKYLVYHREGWLYKECFFVHGKKHGLEREFYKDGKVKVEIPHVNGHVHGVRKEYTTFQGYHLRSESPYVDGSKEGVEKHYLFRDRKVWKTFTYHRHKKHGPQCERKGKGGPLVETGQWKDGKRHGRFLEFWDGGQLKQECFWKDGELHGLMRRFWTDGKMSYQCPYVNGKSHGDAVKYQWSNGKTIPKEVTTYEHGKMRRMVLYDEDGKVVSDKSY